MMAELTLRQTFIESIDTSEIKAQEDLWCSVGNTADSQVSAPSLPLSYPNSRTRWKCPFVALCFHH